MENSACPSQIRQDPITIYPSGQITPFLHVQGWRLNWHCEAVLQNSSLKKNISQHWHGHIHSQQGEHAECNTHTEQFAPVFTRELGDGSGGRLVLYTSNTCLDIGSKGIATPPPLLQLFRQQTSRQRRKGICLPPPPQVLLTRVSRF